MKSLLLQLYDGEVFPAEQYTPKTEEYRKLRQEHYKHYEDFVKQLKVLEPPLDKRFVEIMDEQLDTLPKENQISRSNFHSLCFISCWLSYNSSLRSHISFPRLIAA